MVDGAACGFGSGGVNDDATHSFRNRASIVVQTQQFRNGASTDGTTQNFPKWPSLMVGGAAQQFS